MIGLGPGVSGSLSHDPEGVVWFVLWCVVGHPMVWSQGAPKYTVLCHALICLHWSFVRLLFYLKVCPAICLFPGDVSFGPVVCDTTSQIYQCNSPENVKKILHFQWSNWRFWFVLIDCTFSKLPSLPDVYKLCYWYAHHTWWYGNS